MRAALRIIYAVAEAQDGFLKIVGILHRDLNADPFAGARNIYRIVDTFLIGIQFFYEACDSFRFGINDTLRLCPAKIGILDRKFRIQVGRFMKPGFDLIFGKPCLFEDFGIRKEIDGRSRLPGSSYNRNQAVLQFYDRLSTFIAVMIDRTAGFDLNIQIGGKGVHDRRADAVKAAARLIRIIIKFGSGMKGCKNKTLSRHPFFMHVNRDSAAVIGYGAGSVGFQRDFDQCAESGQMFVDRIIENFINEMIKSFSSGPSDVHSRTYSDRFQSFQNGNAGSVINFLRHFYSPPYSRAL